MKAISVIIPNYNYARFLKRRLDSIAFQTVKPSEIIFLDDCSNDNSIEIAKALLLQYGIPYQIVANEKNQGVFKQWIKGIELVKNELFWIAEADDYSELNFLETLTRAFEDEDMILSYCQSNVVNEKGKHISFHKDENSKYIKTNRWDFDYINECKNELENYLAVFSTIANISAVVFNKKFIPLDSLDKIIEYKYSGDWLFLLNLLLSNPDKKISYSSKILNYWVRHSKSIWNKGKSFSDASSEILTIYYETLSKTNLPIKSQNLIANTLFKHFLHKREDVQYPNLVYGVLMRLDKEVRDFFFITLISKLIELNTIAKREEYKILLVWYKISEILIPIGSLRRKCCSGLFRMIFKIFRDKIT